MPLSSDSTNTLIENDSPIYHSFTNGDYHRTSKGNSFENNQYSQNFFNLSFLKTNFVGFICLMLRFKIQRFLVRSLNIVNTSGKTLEKENIGDTKNFMQYLNIISNEMTLIFC